MQTRFLEIYFLDNNQINSNYIDVNINKNIFNNCICFFISDFKYENLCSCFKIF